MDDRRGEDEAALGERLAAASTAEERGLLHAALAVCAGRALAYRRMNQHEEASALAYAERSEALRAGVATYRAAMAAFAAREDAQGLMLLRAAQPVIVAELGDRHPYAQQVTNTLAGRLGGSETLVERLALRSWLVAGSTALYGATHTHTLQCVANEAYLLAALGRVDEAIAGFERAIDGLVAGPWPGQAANLLPPLARLWALQGAPERTAAREQLVLAHAPGSRWTVREVFFGRAPEVAARYAARVLEHAAVHFPGLREAVLAGRGGPAIALAGGEASSAAAFMGAVHAVVEDGGGAAGLAAEWVLAALARRDRELRGGGGGEDGDGDGDGEDSEGPLATAERAWQEALFDALLRGEDG